MVSHSGLSPVFVYEAITAARRWQVYALRVILVLAMLIALAVVWLSGEPGSQANVQASRQFLAELGYQFYCGAAGIQLAMAFLVAPAATAGAVCVDRTRGWLAHMFVTKLSDAEIVLGKFAVRFSLIVALVFVSVPVIALVGLLGGIVPEALLILTTVTLAVSLLGCAVALALSVRASKTHEVLMVVFMIWSVWLLSVPLWVGAARSKIVPAPPEWAQKLNPFVLVYAPYVWPGYVDAKDVLVFVAALLVVSTASLVFTIRHLRRELAAPGRESRRLRALRQWVHTHLFSWWPSPTLDGSPVLWREWHRNRPSQMARTVSVLFVIAALAGVGFGIADTVTHGIDSRGNLEGVDFLTVTFGLLILSANAPTSLAEERVRGSLDVLITTPLSTLEIVLGKWWAVYRRVLPLVIVPALAGFFVAAASLDRPTWLPAQLLAGIKPVTTVDRVFVATLPSAFLLAHAAAATSFGLLLATWFKRTGRAVALSVGGFVVMSIGLIFAIMLVVRPFLEWWSRHVREMPSDVIFAVCQNLIALSPMGGQTAPFDVLTTSLAVERDFIWKLLLYQLAFLVLLAVLLLGLTLLTFNRCLDRMNESPWDRRFRFLWRVRGSTRYGTRQATAGPPRAETPDSQRALGSP
jgi:ABC-type transport system involved in multi-copper enzyme maturation permease subunit